MSILVYADSANNKLHKSAFEAVSYASQMADGDQVVALVAGEAEGLESLGKYGADKVLHCKDAALADFQPTLIAAALKAAAEKEGAKTIIFPHDLSGKSVAPILAAKMDAGLVSGAVALPDTTDCC